MGVTGHEAEIRGFRRFTPRGSGASGGSLPADRALPALHSPRIGDFRPVTLRSGQDRLSQRRGPKPLLARKPRGICGGSEAGNREPLASRLPAAFLSFLGVSSVWTSECQLPDGRCFLQLLRRISECVALGTYRDIYFTFHLDSVTG